MGSIPITRFSSKDDYARVAQLVERDLAKVEAAGSSPVSRFCFALKTKVFGAFSFIPLYSTCLLKISLC
ncbi:MAG: hypothetical protein RHS_4066 [Robinsoniella sp. RHS]|nr:MAG: hypothetical protein RHS_4066 [Robinsoniella sp. RHS]